MIVLLFPDTTERLLTDDDARRLADLLWEMAQDARTATIAVAIHDELRRRRRQPIDVSQQRVDHVSEALARLNARTSNPAGL